MAVQRPTPDDLAAIARQFHFAIPGADARLRGVGRGLPGPLRPARRAPGAQAAAALAARRRVRPRPEENRLGAWAWRVRIEGASSGPLVGRTVAIKDNVAVAGVPMHNGTALLDGYVPDEDATVVERVLDAGGTILGKAVCESLCFSGGSHTADSGPVRNPYDPARSTGGSSTGSAALVAAGEVDMAIGGDQGGSVRIPSCWSGIYGLKPTWGLVPYTGVPDRGLPGPSRPDGRHHQGRGPAAVGAGRPGRAGPPPARRAPAQRLPGGTHRRRRRAAAGRGAGRVRYRRAVGGRR